MISPPTFRRIRTGDARLTVRRAHLQLEAQVQELREELALAQADLEMDALRRAKGQLEAAHHDYAQLFDFAPIGYLSLDRNGCIQTANVTSARMLGQRRVNLLGRPLLMFI